ncbi:trypsin-like peptidase domain-containing protein [Hyalangium gracile]|uniref:trypsin-like peptidase domain-containing protein n=1 Tax=Hyalangium gracile TaxID=394092 RepID=UPI001CCBE768|nr:trypsin-like peptidase domain-containing protein [Hyalangium gracile]
MRIKLRVLSLSLLAVALTGGCRSSSSSAPAGEAPPTAPARPPVAAVPPSVPEGFVVRPVFETEQGPLAAGTAFFVTIPGQPGPLGLTAHHLFGPAGGLERQVLAGELGRFVKAAGFRELDGQELNPAGPMVVLPSAGHAPDTDEVDWSMDVAAFRAPESLAPRALRLSAKNAEVGEEVWLVAEVLGGKTASQRMHRARVATSKPRLLAYSFEDTTLVMRATSGAPVVNARGEVVGIHLAGGLVDGTLWGQAHPVESVRTHLAQGLSAPALQPR